MEFLSEIATNSACFYKFDKPNETSGFLSASLYWPVLQDARFQSEALCLDSEGINGAIISLMHKSDASNVLLYRISIGPC